MESGNKMSSNAYISICARISLQCMTWSCIFTCLLCSFAFICLPAFPVWSVTPWVLVRLYSFTLTVLSKLTDTHAMLPWCHVAEQSWNHNFSKKDARLKILWSTSLHFFCSTEFHSIINAPVLHSQCNTWGSMEFTVPILQDFCHSSYSYFCTCRHH